MLRVRERQAESRPSMLKQMTAAAGKIAISLQPQPPEQREVSSAHHRALASVDVVAPYRANYLAEELHEDGKDFLSISVLPTFL